MKKLILVVLITAGAAGAGALAQADFHIINSSFIPRPVRPVVLDGKTSNLGISDIDAKWSNYGKYLQNLADTVQVQWKHLNDKNKFRPPEGTKISVKFRLDSEGKIAEIVDADGNGGTQATRICVSAITDRAPYGKWTDDMVAMLGDSQEMTFTFYYGMP
jgi:hypothetical protein